MGKRLLGCVCICCTLTSPSLVYAATDMAELESQFSLPRASSINGFSFNTLNAFGVKDEFLATLKVEGWIIDPSMREWERASSQIERGQEFIPVLRSILSRSNVPQEFLFLAMVESEFNSVARSNKKAVGIWQIMPATAKSLGLTVNEYIDERKDPVRSTEAAVKYLSYLYEATGKWYLAAMAYNCGLGRLQAAIKQAGSDDIEVLLDSEKKYLPLETRRYIRKIMSMSIAFNNAYLLKLENKEHMLNMGANDTIVKVDVKAGHTLARVAESVGMTLDQLKRYNRHLRYDFLPPGRDSYRVYIPYNRLSTFKMNFKEEKFPLSSFVLHKVKKGETLTSISKRYNLSISRIMLANSLKGSFLSINQVLLLPILKEERKYKAVRLDAGIVKIGYNGR